MAGDRSVIAIGAGGAYTYGSDRVQGALAALVAGTLFFAGEATDVTGNNGTLHGAMASGYGAAGARS